MGYRASCHELEHECTYRARSRPTNPATVHGFIQMRMEIYLRSLYYFRDIFRHFSLFCVERTVRARALHHGCANLTNDCRIWSERESNRRQEKFRTSTSLWMCKARNPSANHAQSLRSCETLKNVFARKINGQEIVFFPNSLIETVLNSALRKMSGNKRYALT